MVLFINELLLVETANPSVVAFLIVLFEIIEFDADTMNPTPVEFKK